MPLMETSTLETRIFDVLRLDTPELAEAKGLILQANAAKFETDQAIEDEVDRTFLPPAYLMVPTADEYVNGVSEDTLLKEADYTAPDRGRFAPLFRKKDKDQRSAAISYARTRRANNYDTHARNLQEQNDRKGRNYESDRQQQIDSKGPSKESLYGRAKTLLEQIMMQDPLNFRGSKNAPDSGAFTSQDRDVAAFLFDYVLFRERTWNEDLEAMTHISENSEHTGLRALRAPLILEQAKAFIDIGNYNLAVEAANKIVDDKSVNGEASYLRGEAYLRAGNLDLAALEFKTSYVVNPNRQGIDDKIIAVIKGQISVGNVAKASSFLDDMIDASRKTALPFSEERKNRLLLSQATALMESGAPNYDLAYKVASAVDDNVLQGQASYLKGQISLRRAKITNSVGGLLDAEWHLRNAFILDPNVEGLQAALVETYFGLAQAVQDKNNDFNAVMPEVAATYKEAARKFADGVISDRPDGTLGAKALFSKVLDAFGYVKPAESSPLIERVNAAKVYAFGTELRAFGTSVDDASTTPDLSGFDLSSLAVQYESLKQKYASLVAAGVPQEKLAPIATLLQGMTGSFGGLESAVKASKSDYEQRPKVSAGEFESQFNATRESFEISNERPIDDTRAIMTPMREPGRDIDYKPGDKTTVGVLQRVIGYWENKFYERLANYDWSKKRAEFLKGLNPATTQLIIRNNEDMMRACQSDMIAIDKLVSATGKLYQLLTNGLHASLSAALESKSKLEAALQAQSAPYMAELRDGISRIRSAYTSIETLAKESEINPYGVVMRKFGNELGPRLAGLNAAESLMLAKALQYMAHISLVEGKVPDALGFDRTNPGKIGYAGQSLAVMQTQRAYLLLADQLSGSKKI